MRLEYRDGALRYEGGETSNTIPDTTIASRLAASFRTRAFVFHAERPVIGRGNLSNHGNLVPDASNLPQALNRLQTTNEPRFAKLQQHVKEVFPHLEGLDARTDGAEAEVWMWPIAKTTERPDLAVRLVESGTGVGQALGILTVVVSAPPSTIVIDEPQSFLHPGAIRRLFAVLNRYPQHQYIVVTHSPAVIAAAEPKAIGLVRRTNAGSTVANVAQTSQSALRELLAEVGASFADVFGADRVLWVEGPTEVEAFRHILRERLGEPPQGLEVVPVRSVDELGGRDVERILDVYRRVMAHGATLLPRANFVFDGEHQEKLEKRGSRWFRCLPVRNFETFLLDADSIVEWLGEKRECLHGPIDREVVAAWLEERDAGDDTDGAKVLRDLLRELSKAKCEFKKPEDSVRLTEIVLRRASARFDRLIELLRPIVSSD
jgi:AAA domain, putative AbiEii toxin, Type IV TA system